MWAKKTISVWEQYWKPFKCGQIKGFPLGSNVGNHLRVGKKMIDTD